MSESLTDQERQALRQIRGHFAAFGYDVSDLTDEELAAALRDGIRRFAAAGVTAAEAHAAISRAFGALPPAEAP